jgi:WD40 repeat protein
MFMKLQLIILSLLLSLFKDSFCAQKKSRGVTISYALVEASEYFRAMDELGKLRNGDPKIPFSSLSSLDLLNGLVKTTFPHEGDYLLQFSPTDLAHAAIDAETLRLDQKYIDCIKGTLEEQLTQHPQSADAIEAIIEKNPIVKLSLIQSIIGNIPYQVNFELSGVIGISLDPEGKKMLTLYQNGKTILWSIDHQEKSLTEVKELQMPSADQSPITEASFSPNKGFIVLVRADAIAIFDQNLELKHSHTKATPNKEDFFTTVVFSRDYRKHTILSKKTPAETFCAGKPQTTQFPDGDSGIFNCLAYHPDHEYNNLVATHKSKQPAIKLWNFSTGTVVQYFDIDGPNLFFTKLLFGAKELFAQGPTEINQWEMESESKHQNGSTIYKCPGGQTIKCFCAFGSKTMCFRATALDTRSWALNKKLTCAAVTNGEIVRLEFTPETPTTVMAALVLAKSYKKKRVPKAV